MEVWRGALCLPVPSVYHSEEGTQGQQAADAFNLDLRFVTSLTGDFSWLNIVSLHYLSCVELSRIPLHMIAGPSLQVQTDDVGSGNWLQELLELYVTSKQLPVDAPGADVDPASASKPEQGLGLLAKVIPRPQAVIDQRHLQITELLFSLDNTSRKVSQTEPNVVHVIPLSSELRFGLLHDAVVSADVVSENRFLPPLAPPNTLDNSRKRDRLTEIFNDATDKRRKGRKKGGESISIAASKAANISPSLGMLGPFLNKAEDNIDSQTLDPEAGDKDQPPRRRAQLTAVEVRPETSQGLSKHTGFVNGGSAERPEEEHATLDAQNKQMMSRAVMTGMRLYGLQQRKPISKQTCLGTYEPGSRTCPQVRAESQSDDEFKLIYHQTYKSTLFAFRQTITSSLVDPGAIRDVVDKLLAIFYASPS